MITPPKQNQSDSDIKIVNDFPFTYRNREDITNLPPGVLVVGSQNIISNVSERLQVRQGYKIDGSQLFYIRTIAASTNALTLSSTLSLSTGDVVTVYFDSGLTGLTSGEEYYLIVSSNTTVKFASSRENALAGTAITVTGTPQSGRLTLEKSSTNLPILSSFDWNSKGNSEIHMRAGFDSNSATADGRLQFRYVNASGDVFWTDLATGLSSVDMNFTTFWDTTELVRETLYVDGTSNIYKWNGAYDEVVSTTASSITVVDPVGPTGFFSQGNRVLTIRGVDYTYASASSSTFHGVTPTPATGNDRVYAGDILVQKPVTISNTSATGGPSSTFENGLISTLNNQVFIGSKTSPTGYMSKINNFLDYSQTAGTRLPGDGATFTLDDNLVAFIPQEENMYISAGKNFWYNTTLVQSTVFNGTDAITGEVFKVELLKTNPRQGVQSQGLTGKMKNNIIAVTYEPTFDLIGRVDQILGTPQTTNISDPIKLDFDTYDFTDGHVFYNKYNCYVSVPQSGLIRIYSLITESWEPPQTMPISRFYTVDGEIYGHSYGTSESYQLFTGFSDRATAGEAGNPYLAVANFSYQNFGTRTELKNANEFYIEGYISGNTELNCVVNYEQDGNLTQQTFTVEGDDMAFTGGQDSLNSIGAKPFGQEPLGSTMNTSLTGLPPKFRVIKTFNRFDFYECQFSFSILGVDQNFQLLAFGMNVQKAGKTNSAISD